jgi:hypothetical protein
LVKLDQHELAGPDNLKSVVNALFCLLSQLISREIGLVDFRIEVSNLHEKLQSLIKAESSPNARAREL